MGVWIETNAGNQFFNSMYVTPFVGVWIETSYAVDLQNRIESHPSWVCGLKLQLYRPLSFACSVTPFVGVWIETLN